MTKKTAGKTAAGGGKATKRESSGWSKSACTNKLLEQLDREGLILPEAEGKWWRPDSESILTLANDERVAFVDHITRGLSFPLHPFFLVVLCVYGVKLHDLPPPPIMCST